jgi:hypothetical protein
MASDDEELPAYLTRGRQRAARRRFLARGGTALAALASMPLLGATARPAAAQDDDGTGGGADAGAINLPPYRSRTRWGADERRRRDAGGASLWPVAFFPVQTITVHHTGGATPRQEHEARVLVDDIYHEHAVELGYGDIGYHLLIGPEGAVYEGRYSGGTNFPVFDVWPGDRPGPRMVTAAHVHNHNAGNIGVAVLGDYSEADTTDAAWWSLTVVVALLAAAAGLDPEGTAAYVNPVNGLERRVPVVAGHDSWAWTSCPGVGMSQWLPALRADAASLAARLAGAWLA